MDVRFVDSAGAHDHDSDDIVELLCRDDGFVWVDVPSWDDQVEAFLTGLGCHPRVIEACRQRNTCRRSTRTPTITSSPCTARCSGGRPRAHARARPDRPPRYLVRCTGR
jgi:hypothetical protein